MKIYDDVKFIGNDKNYKGYEIKNGEIGTIILPEIRDNCFYVTFIDPSFVEDDRFAPIKISDLELVKSSTMSDDKILKNLPKNDPRWWCKVEDGYILNLLGEKKNKIPYDYKS